MHPYGSYSRPELAELLELVGLDASFVRSEGDVLWRQQADSLVPVLDMVGGYGTNLLGHWHPELVAYAQELLQNRVPVFAQCSMREGAAELSRALAERLGPYIVHLTNSGTETIEAALKHAYLERERPMFWAVKRAFHGKTTGAVQLTWNYHAPFASIGPKVRFIDPDDPADWENARRSANDVSAAFIEVIQGEGGVRELPRAFLEWLAATCKEFGIPLVADEIQTGCGRTGSFLASHAIGLDPDYVCLGKALGGGIAKIGALLIKRDRYVQRFSVIHSSTYAEDDWSSLLALKTLEILDRDALPRRCAEMGSRLLEQLEQLRQEFPNQIRDVRGRGLMIGLEFAEQHDGTSTSLRTLSRQGHLGYVAASYFLNVHHVRILPALSDSLTMRMEPSAYITQADVDRVIEAVRRYCEAIAASDLLHLIQHRIGRTIGGITQYNHVPRTPARVHVAPRHVAFIGHLLSASDALAYEPSLAPLNEDEIGTFIEMGSRLLEPAVLHRENIHSKNGGAVHLTFIGLAITAKQFADAHRDGRAWIMRKIEAAAEMARRNGCQIVGMGGHTSIVSGDCRRLRVEGLALTSGNALTAGIALRALTQGAEDLGIELRDARLAVIGAGGNIGCTFSVMLAPLVREIVLIVRDVRSPRTQRVVNAIRAAAPNTVIRVSNDVADVYGCSLIAAASSAEGSLIRPEHIWDEPTVICDIAVPGDVDPSVSTLRPNAVVLQGGLVRLPRNEEFHIPAMPVKRGHVFACMAETLLMGLEGMTTHGSYGAISPQQVRDMLALADEHGFTSVRAPAAPHVRSAR